MDCRDSVLEKKAVEEHFRNLQKKHGMWLAGVGSESLSRDAYAWLLRIDDALVALDYVLSNIPPSEHTAYIVTRRSNNHAKRSHLQQVHDEANKQIRAMQKQVADLEEKLRDAYLARETAVFEKERLGIEDTVLQKKLP